jgi:hypothetical protein
VLQAYSDDSGNNADSPVFVLAGFIARAEKWIEFEKRWAEALSGPPSIAYFKMKECAALRGQFGGWGNAARDERLASLVRIIKETALASIFALVRRADFTKHLGQLRGAGFKTPYPLVYYSLMSVTLRCLRDNSLISEKIDFIFDEQLRLSDTVQSIYTRVLAAMPDSMRSRIGGRPIHGSDRKFLPLQAADLFAWHIRRWYFANEKGKEFESPTLSILRTIPYWGIVHSGESLDDLLTNANLLRLKRYFESPEFRAHLMSILRK